MSRGSYMRKQVLTLILLMAVALPLPTFSQFPDKQIPVYVFAKPHKPNFALGEPILIDVEINNGLKEEIRISVYSFSPNSWNGEILGIEFPDIYRLPRVVQIYRERPKITDMPRAIAAPSWIAIAPGSSRVKTIDVGKWQVNEGWIKGKYQLVVRADKIDVDSYSWMSVNSEPFTFEIK
jgi:hypothetical protein